MTLQLRQRHRRIISVLAVLVGIIFVWGILQRRPVPQVQSLPPELLPRTQTFTATEREWTDLFEKSPVRVQLWRDLQNGSLAVGFSAAKELVKPDLLAYWSASSPGPGDRLPTDARLLGALIAGPLALPDEASRSAGSLILFSLAEHEIVDRSKPTRLTDRE